MLIKTEESDHNLSKFKGDSRILIFNKHIVGADIASTCLW